jgi:hypothetical protein
MGWNFHLNPSNWLSLGDLAHSVSSRAKGMDKALHFGLKPGAKTAAPAGCPADSVT